MNATATMNGKPTRKQLADQLDRLDQIIDGLAEALPGAVAEACRDGARLAVRDAIIEIVSNAELRALLVPAIPTTSVPTPVPPAPVEPLPSPEPKRPSMWSRLKAKIQAAKAAVVGVVVNAKQAVVRRWQGMLAAIHAVGLAGGEPVPVRQISVTALAVGVVVGFACLLVPETVAAAIGGIGAASTAVCLQFGGWLRRVACRVGLLV